MNWKQWILVGVMALGALTSVLNVGRERKPLDPGTASLTVLLSGLLIWLIVTI